MKNLPKNWPANKKLCLDKTNPIWKALKLWRQKADLGHVKGLKIIVVMVVA